MQQEISLYELNNRVKNALNVSFPKALRVVAEISEINENRNGHCYLNLVEKSENDDSIRAQARATIWSYTYRMLKPFFETTTGRKLSKGLKVLLSVDIVFHEMYGYSLNIKDIDTNYTLGDIERRRREVLKKLEEDGVINMNKELEFPIHPKRIAVISSKSAAGYGDFVNQLDNNQEGFSFIYKLFPAVMQGENASNSIISAFEQIYEQEDKFDVVVIIRGGGASSDLACFDTYELAINMAQFTLPIIAGIGHERDVTIADMVSHTRVKTPTAAAIFLIEKTGELANFLYDLEKSFTSVVEEILLQNRHELEHIFKGFVPIVNSLIKQGKTRHRIILSSLSNSCKFFIKDKKTKPRLAFERIVRDSSNVISIAKKDIQSYERIVSLANPVNILKKGYSLTYIGNVLVKDLIDIKLGEKITTKLSGGEISSNVIDKKRYNG